MDGRLEEVFVDVFTKRLAPTEIKGRNRSKTQAIQVGGATDMLGEPTGLEEFICRYIKLDDDAAPEECTTVGKYSDPRRDDPSRPAEWRLGYTNAQRVMTELAKPGDHVWIMRLRKEPQKLVLVLAPAGSEVAKRLGRLMGTSLTAQDSLPEITTKEDFVRGDVISAGSSGIDFEDAELLELLGVPLTIESPNLLDAALARFARLPRAEVLSRFVRDELGLDPRDGVDEVFMAWNVVNDEVFFVLEEREVQATLNEHFAMQENIDVAQFFHVAKSRTNARFARAGLSFESHLAAVFDAFGLRYVAQARKMVDGSKPDFLLPGLVEYSDDELVHLTSFVGAKTTAKERWLQLKGEAVRVDHAFLATKDKAIAPATLKRMVINAVYPVMAKPIIDEFYRGNADLILTLADFIEEALQRQGQLDSIVGQRASY